MRLAFDGLPRDLPLSPAERRRLRAAVRAWKPPRGLRPPLWIALIPSATGAIMFLVVFTAINCLPGLGVHRVWAWVLAVLLPMCVVQFWLTGRLMRAALWPHTCRAMAANGYEVCLRCAYPLKETDPQRRQCPECGAERLGKV